MARSGGAPKARLRLDSGSAGDVSSMEARPKRLFGRRAERSLERSLQLPASPDTIRCQFSCSPVHMRVVAPARLSAVQSGSFPRCDRLSRGHILSAIKGLLRPLERRPSDG